MEDIFQVVIGEFVSTCGLIETQVNYLLIAMARDGILVNNLLQSPLQRRVKVLRKMLEKRAPLPPDFVETFCANLGEVIEGRNLVAHSPIYHRDNQEYVGPLKGRYDDVPGPKRLSKADLQELVTKANEAASQITRIQISFAKRQARRS